MPTNVTVSVAVSIAVIGICWFSPPAFLKNVNRKITAPNISVLSLSVGGKG